MKILVTGANGFVGRALCPSLEQAGHVPVRAVRRLGRPGELAVGDIGPDTDWRAVLDGVDAVIHLAARVHVMHDTQADPLAAFRQVNTAGTLNLARQAGAAGVGLFLFASSIKVNGEGCMPDEADEGACRGIYSEACAAAPQDAYAQSKREAELGLQALARAGGMRCVSLRLPLVYGPGVGANFLRLMRSVERGLPLPLGAVRNRRSLLFLGNLVDALQHCLAYPHSLGDCYLLSDGEPVSTPELMRILAGLMGRQARLPAVPVAWLERLASLLGKGEEIRRLLGTLEADSRLFREELQWTPPFTLRAGLQQTVDWYLQQSCR